MNPQFDIKILPTYRADLLSAVRYIAFVLHNKTAAQNLINETERGWSKVLVQLYETSESAHSYVRRRDRCA